MSTPMRPAIDWSRVPEGLYRIHWANGGSSLAAIGIDRRGKCWIAPTNWTSPMTSGDPEHKKYLEMIVNIDLLVIDIPR